eukprot:CAMPEP_0194032590 /NCGR_PEP_ID=MMETSP0009_2-20130614/5500_1 /TAXON_ID=210454 /ORGANISM="Grammatophora oceanica, Strain CCMP 410" /LENGTH=210 /DNA_ID=CAMNT_0038673077 /DNA_START=247 /DNA_END=879 /DNA_ORIENTATION=+
MDQTSTISRSNQRNRRYRGALALLGDPMPKYEYNPELLQQSSTFLRKRTARNRVSTGQEAIVQPEKEFYDTSRSEWTLIFVGDPTNRNSLRCRPLLVDFVQRHTEQCQCIYLTNREGTDALVLAEGTGFYVVEWSHPNRSALIQFLAVTRVPSVIVVENRSGRRITDWGMEAIDARSDSAGGTKEMFEAWRRRGSGLPLCSALTTACTLS